MIWVEITPSGCALGSDFNPNQPSSLMISCLGLNHPLASVLLLIAHMDLINDLAKIPGYQKPTIKTKIVLQYSHYLDLNAPTCLGVLTIMLSFLVCEFHYIHLGHQQVSNDTFTWLAVYVLSHLVLSGFFIRNEIRLQEGCE